jgi:hypothetical protein
MTSRQIGFAAIAFGWLASTVACGGGGEHSAAPDPSQGPGTAPVASAPDEAPRASSEETSAAVEAVELSEADLDAFERGFAKEIELVLAAMKKGEEATTPEERGKAAQEAWQQHTVPLAAQAVGLAPERYRVIRETVTTVLATLDLRGDIEAPMEIDPARVTPELQKRLDGDPFAPLSTASATALRARLDRMVPLWTRYVVLGAMAG